MDTIHYAEGKEAIILPNGLEISKDITHKLYAVGIKYIITRGASNSIDELQGIAEQMIKDLDRTNKDNWLLQVS
ncbi:hypothetical protein [Mucilaginibacter antarcticus]|uniref:hypothetical protein n=1 Tax=Mucilaginibacter antarcticus TaxID=1855725 RepID=UPI003633907E